MKDTEQFNTSVMKQARLLFNAWARKNKLDKLHTESLDDLVFDIYKTEHRRDLELDEALTELLMIKRLEHAPEDTQAVALANLRYVDAI